MNGRLRKVYLVSIMDDASRLLAHSAFCTGETALDIEGVLKVLALCASFKHGAERRSCITTQSVVTRC